MDISEEQRTYEERVKNISDQQLESVVISIQSLEGEAEALAVKIFKSFFKAHPDYQNQFPKFSDVPNEELESNKDFIRHALAVLTAIVKSINNLRNSNAVLSDLQKLGQAHYRRNIQSQQFEEVSNVIIEVLSEQITDVQVLNTWKELLNIFSSSIISFMDKS